MWYLKRNTRAVFKFAYNGNILYTTTAAFKDIANVNSIYQRRIKDPPNHPCRSSRSQMFFKTAVLKNLANFTGKHPC